MYCYQILGALVTHMKHVGLSSPRPLRPYPGIRSSGLKYVCFKKMRLNLKLTDAINLYRGLAKRLDGILNNVPFPPKLKFRSIALPRSPKRADPGAENRAILDVGRSIPSGPRRVVATSYTSRFLARFFLTRRPNARICIGGWDYADIYYLSWNKRSMPIEGPCFRVSSDTWIAPSSSVSENRTPDPAHCALLNEALGRSFSIIC
jgi:hypothetical protein